MSTGYDRIARFYDVDMAQNMRFDDVAFYRDACTGRDPVLELGCGNGRILLALAAAGHDAWGVDASVPMLAGLQAKAAGRALKVRVEPADVRALALPQRFGAILCPYSLVTYLVRDDDVQAMLAGARAHLAPGGVLVVDAFVPRPVAAFDDFRLDYRRAWNGRTLARWKRIRALSDGTNRIERRYEVHDAGGAILETVEVAETIRPYAPAELRAQLARAGFAVAGEWWDYGTRADPDGAQFCTLAAHAAA